MCAGVLYCGHSNLKHLHMTNIAHVAQMSTPEKVAELYTLYERVERAERTASDLLINAKQNGDNELPIAQADGSGDKMVKERHLWREVEHLGSECNAGRVLQEKYPKVFEAYTTQNRLADELREFTIAAFQIDYTQLKLSDIVRMFEMLFDYRVSRPLDHASSFGQRLRWLLTGK